jgi:hypothetical protein
MVSTSLKADRQIFAWPPIWIPDPIIWGNYPAVFIYAPPHLYFQNTLMIATAPVFGAILTCSLAAYVFSRVQAPGLYFTELVDDRKLERLVREVLSVMACEPRYVLGIADQVPPDGLRRRVAQVRELVDRYGAYW